MQLTTALNGHVNTFDFFNRYKNSGNLIKVEQAIHRSDTDITHSANSWSSSGAVNLRAGRNLSVVGAQINSQGYSASAGGAYEERAAYDIQEKVKVESVKHSGVGTWVVGLTADAAMGLGPIVGHKATENANLTETQIDSTRTAVLTNIDAGSGKQVRAASAPGFKGSQCIY